MNLPRLRAAYAKFQESLAIAQEAFEVFREELANAEIDQLPGMDEATTSKPPGRGPYWSAKTCPMCKGTHLTGHLAHCEYPDSVRLEP